MITQKQHDKIDEMINRYLSDERLITVNEIRTFGEKLTPTSPKSNREVTFGTICNYVRGKIPSHCTKYDLMYVLAYIRQSNEIKTVNRLGFFDA